MYINEFHEILHGECANCTKYFGGDKNSSDSTNEIEWSTTLVFSNIQFISPLEDITNFQAISYIYGVPPIRLEDSIKKHLLTTDAKKQNPNQVSTSETNEEENKSNNPLSSFSLPLCQTCSVTLAELYAAFYKFEKLSNKKSIISKGIQNSKVNNFADIKLENLCEIVCKSPNNFDCLEQSNENSNKIVEQSDELNSFKEELDSVSECSFNSSNSGTGDGNGDAEEIDKAADLETEWKNASLCGIVTRRSSKRLSGKNDKQYESLTSNDGFKEKPAEDDDSPSEESDSSTFDESDNRKANAAKRKIKSSKTTPRRSRIAKRAKRSRQTSVTSTLNIKDRRYKSKVLGLHSLRCILCKVYLSSARTFKRHHQIRHKIILKDNNSMEKWMDICTSKCYNCDICDEFFISNQELNFHLIAHYCKYQDTTVERNEVICGPPFLCPKCENSDKQYENETLLQLHGLKAHKVAFKSQQSSELVKDTTSKTSFCNECDITFAFEQNKYWAEHMKKLHHVCGCYICHNTFPDENLLHLHIKTVHLLPKSRSCPICDKEFPNLRCLWMHTLVHVAEGDENIMELQTFEDFATPFLIIKGSELQNEVDKDKSSLEGDYYVNHYCLKCSKGFKSFYAMKIHQAAQSIIDFDKLSRKELNGRDFHCPTCGIDFKRNIILREHCLSKHQMIVSTKTYRAEEFLKELLEEKEDCKGLTIPETKPLNKKKVCKNCCKFFNSYYHKKCHEVAYTKDISTMERQIVEKVDGNCPRCEISFNNTAQQGNAYLQFKVHCLTKHDLIISINTRKLDIFTQWLLNEKEYCCKNQTVGGNVNKDNIAIQIETSSDQAVGSNLGEICLKENKDFNPNVKRNCKMMPRSKSGSGHKLCYRCGKNCISHYAKKYHEMSHKLDINSLQKEKLKGEKCNCPRCEIHFAKSGIGLYKLKLHCLEEHKLIIARSSVDLEKFFEFLQNEKEHCNKNKKITSTLYSDKNDVGNAVQEMKKSSKNTNKKYACRFCGKVYKISMKKMHELSHQIDLTKVEMENSHCTSDLICHRCGRTFKSALHLRLHCLENHNVIVSTGKYSGETFMNLLTEEQELINRTQKDNPALNSDSQTVPEKTQKIRKQNTSKQNSDVNAGGDIGSVNEDTTEVASQKFVCDVCGKVTQDHVALFGHKVSHQTEKKFICERCGASFKTANLFRSHMRVHFEKDNGIRPSCNICGKDFISSRNLFRHKTYYHPKKKKNCPVCNKTFASNRYAAKHIKKHTAAMK